MKNIFEKIYSVSMEYASKKYSWIILSFISFIESIFFPIPVDVFLAPMILAQRNKAFFFIFITIFFSVIGGIMGYVIGIYFWDLIQPTIENYYPSFEQGFYSFKNSFSEIGWYLILIGGFTPLPYKIVTISSGILQLDIINFILCSLVSRSARFILVGYMFYRYGKGIKKILEKNINTISFVLILFFVFYIFHKSF